jgi:hypothetical protein
MYSGLQAEKNERFCQIPGEIVLLRDIIALEGSTGPPSVCISNCISIALHYIPPMGLHC